MKNWVKKTITKKEIGDLHERFGVDAITASIMARRGITDGADVQYFLEDDLRFLHNPFLFSSMEDAVDRILQAKDEEENVLIFGDRDVDGITSTAVLYDCLSALGIHARWRLPNGTDPYGLSKAAVDDFEKEYGTLIITVDCGISNTEEIAYAAEKGMDVIVIDHHNPPETLPSPAIIINPKCDGSGYPFRDISGCAVVYKTVCALRFARSELYKNEVALLTVVPGGEDGSFTVEILKLENLVEKKILHENVKAGTPIHETSIPDFLRGQQIFVWDEAATTSALGHIFGTGTQFNCMDIRPEAAKVIPYVADASLAQLKSKSKIARYNADYNSEIKILYSMFVTLANAWIAAQFPEQAKANERDLQLVALAALADIMPLKNENRVLIRRGIALMNTEKTREGLTELLSMQNLLGKRITASDLAWTVNPALNATGRIGQPEIGLELFLEKDSTKRMAIAEKIMHMNSTRKQLGTDGWNYASETAHSSIAEYGGKLCVVIDGRINRGVSGTIAGKLTLAHNVPAMTITFVEDTAIGSMRSCRGFEVLSLLNKMSDLFISYGGHAYAAGFSFKKERLDEFISALKKHAREIQLGSADSEHIDIDAEIPKDYLTPNLLAVVDSFEPYGEDNRELMFMSKSLRIQDALIVGRKERQHLKLTLECGATKWPALLWGGADCLHRDFDTGDFVDVLYQINRNTYNGVETPQMIIKDIRKSE